MSIWSRFVNDWLHVSGDQQCGVFTVAILVAKQQRKEKR